MKDYSDKMKSEENSDSGDEKPIVKGKHYLVKRSDGTWRKLNSKRASFP